MGLQVNTIITQYDGSPATGGVKLSLSLTASRVYLLTSVIATMQGGTTSGEIQWYFQNSGGTKTLAYAILRDSGARMHVSPGNGLLGPITGQTTLNLDIPYHPSGTPTVRASASLLEKEVT